MQRVSRKGEPKLHTHDDNFARYYQEVGQTEILDAATERKLFLKYRRKRRNKVFWTNTDARDRIVKSCLRFVVKLAHRYANDLNTLKDLVAAGNEGLLFALDRYDPKHSSKTRFLSYATSYILLYIRTELHNAELVTMPLWRQKAIRKVRRARSKVEASDGHLPDTDVICSEVDISPAQLERLQVEKFHYTPIELTRVSTNGNEARAINAQAKDLLERLLLGLGSKERFVLRSYFGLVSDPMSLRRIASVLGVSSERVRQIKVDALMSLRKGLQRELGVQSVDKLLAHVY